MLNYNDTMKVVISFYDDCVHFWKNEVKDDIKACEMALIDIENIKTNPYSPNGKELDTIAKQEFLEKQRLFNSLL